MQANFVFLITIFLLTSCIPTSASPVPTYSVPDTALPVKPSATYVPTLTKQPLSISPYYRIGNGDLEQVKWSASGKEIIVGTSTGIFVYNAENFSLINNFETGGSVSYLAVNPHGEIISTGVDRDNFENIILWNIHNGEQVTTLHGDCNCVFTTVVFSPDGSLLAAGTDNGQVWVWEWASGRIFQILNFENRSDGPFVKYVQFYPDGLSLVAGQEKGVVELFDLHTGEKLKSFANKFSFIDDIQFSPDGKKIAVAGNSTKKDDLLEQYTIQVFDSQTSKFLYAIDLGNVGVDFIRFSPDNKTLVTGNCISYGSYSDVCVSALLRQWNMEDGSFVKIIRKYSSNLVSASYSPDGKHLAVITWDVIPLFEVWDFEKNQVTQSTEWYVGPTSPIIFSPDSKTAMWGEVNGTIQFLDIENRSKVSMWSGDGHEIVNLAVSADGAKLASSSRYGAVTIWDIRAHDVLQKVQTGEGFEIYSLQFSPDNRWLVWAEADIYRDNRVQVYDIQRRKSEIAITGASIYHLAVSPDSSKIAVADFDKNEIRLFNLTTGELLETFNAPDSVSQIQFSSDGTILVGGCSNTNIMFWQISSGKLLESFDAYTSSDNGSIPFAPFPGNRFLVFSSGPRINILDLTNDQIALEKTHYIGGTNDLTISPNGEILATAGYGQAAWLWKFGGLP
jgi:WD40 repeat protein